MTNPVSIRGNSVKALALLLAAVAFTFSAFAAGIDSRTYTCVDVQGLVAARGFIFINTPGFGDFVVSNVSYCGGGNIGSQLQLRSVATTDNPECLVNYCLPIGGTRSGN